MPAPGSPSPVAARPQCPWSLASRPPDASPFAMCPCLGHLQSGHVNHLADTSQNPYNGAPLTTVHFHSPHRSDCGMRQLTEKHKQIALLAATGQLQHKEIAQQVGVHYNTITRVLQMPGVQARIAEIQQQAQEQTVRTLAERFDAAA